MLHSRPKMSVTSAFWLIPFPLKYVLVVSLTDKCPWEGMKKIRCSTSYLPNLQLIVGSCIILERKIWMPIFLCKMCLQGIMRTVYKKWCMTGHFLFIKAFQVRRPWKTNSLLHRTCRKVTLDLLCWIHLSWCTIGTFHFKCQNYSFFSYMYTVRILWVEGWQTQIF